LEIVYARSRIASETSKGSAKGDGISAYSGHPRIEQRTAAAHGERLRQQWQRGSDQTEYLQRRREPEATELDGLLDYSVLWSDFSWRRAVVRFGMRLDEISWTRDFRLCVFVPRIWARNESGRMDFELRKKVSLIFQNYLNLEQF